MNSQTEKSQATYATMQYVSYEAQIAAAIKMLGYAPQLVMQGITPKPNSAMPWAVVEAAKILNVEGKRPMRVESQMKFQIYQNCLSCSDTQKMAIAIEMAKDLVDVIAATKECPGVVEVKSLAIEQPRYITKPNEQVVAEATIRIISTYHGEVIEP